jgi:tetratricopeptide (TPR) repeat protein
MTLTERLDSWKEIAAFLGRGERTVKRWEVDRGLPVHRVPGGGRSAVFAYRSELTEWLGGQKAIEPDAVDAEVPALEIPTEPADDAARTHRGGRWIVVLALIAIGLAVWGWARYRSWPAHAASPHHAPTPEAQDLYLKGRYFWDRRTPADLKTAVDYFTQAIVEDPRDAQAYVGLADCYNLLREFGAMSSSEAYPRALAAAKRAVELDDNSAEAHESLAFTTFWWTWKAATAEREFKRALQLNPNLAQAHHWYATYLMAVHRYEEALKEIEAAQRLEPSSSAILADKAYLLWGLGRHDEAISQLKQLETSVPSLSSTYHYLGVIDWQQGEYAEAIADRKHLAQMRQDETGLAIADASAKGLAAGGLPGLLKSELPIQKQLADRAEGSAYQVAWIYAALGQKNESFTYLQIAFDRREAGLLTGDPPIPSLQNDPAYRSMTAQVASLLAQ